MTTLGSPITFETMLAGSCWQLLAPANGFSGPSTKELITQVAVGRNFELMHDFPKHLGEKIESLRLEVRLLEDGYKCWLELSTILRSAFYRGSWKPKIFNQDQVQKRIPNVLSWLEKAAKQDNKYLWGGTIGPDFDCSGLVQTAFASQEIWLPRDAYQQESFCEKLEFSLASHPVLRPGDLLFFGTLQSCNHVAIHLGDGEYLHSSGIDFGRNGIGCDWLNPKKINAVSSHYRSQIRGAGRVVRSHDGKTLP